eukprot:s1056_g6.t1
MQSFWIQVSFCPDTRTAQQWDEEVGSPFLHLLDPETRGVPGDAGESYLSWGFRKSFAGVWSPESLQFYSDQKLQGRELHPSNGQDPHRMGGDILLDGRGQVVMAHYSKSTRDRPSVKETLLPLLRSLPAPSSRSGSFWMLAALVIALLRILLQKLLRPVRRLLTPQKYLLRLPLVLEESLRQVSTDRFLDHTQGQTTVESMMMSTVLNVISNVVRAGPLDLPSGRGRAVLLPWGLMAAGTGNARPRTAITGVGALLRHPQQRVVPGTHGQTTTRGKPTSVTAVEQESSGTTGATIVTKATQDILDYTAQEGVAAIPGQMAEIAEGDTTINRGWANDWRSGWQDQCQTY